MRKIIILIILSFVFTGELEVDGDLIVTGGIDSPTIDALRDDGDYEYFIIYVYMSMNSVGQNGTVNRSGFLRLDTDNFQTGTPLNSMANFNNEITSIMNDGWKLDSINGSSSSWWIFKKPIEE